MKSIISKTIKALLVCALVLLTNTVSVVASSVTTQAEAHVLTDVQLDKRFKVLKVVVRSPYAYILACTSDNMLWLREAVLDKQGSWHDIGGSGFPIVDKPKKLFRSNGANLQYSTSRRSGHRGDMEYQFPWCLFGYTTDPQVTSFRIKTKTGYVPLETIHTRYFLRILSETEHDNFVEVQGLNQKGEVIQRDNGVDEDKPRQWSPQHSEFY